MKLDINNQYHQAIVGLLAMLVEDAGYSPREVFALLEDIKKQTFFTLMEIHKEKNNEDA